MRNGRHVAEVQELLGQKVFALANNSVGMRTTPRARELWGALDGLVSERVRADVECALRETQAGMAEDLLLLPTLLSLTGGAPGVFVELGAADGMTGSNTFMLERCFNWTGLLIEANPGNFALLKERSGRRAPIVHSSVCNEGSVPFTRFGGMNAARIDAMTDSFKKSNSAKHQLDKEDNVVQVPCHKLSALLDDAGFGHVHYFSLDVEGAEEHVLNATDVGRFDLIETEALPKQGMSWDSLVLEQPGRQRRIDERLHASGFILSDPLWIPWGRVYLSAAQAGKVRPLAGAPDRRALPPKPPGDTKSWRDPWLSGFTWFHKKLGRFAGPRKWLQR